MICAKIAEILLEAHADPNCTTRNGNTVLDALFRPRNYVPESWDGFATFKLLLQYGLSEVQIEYGIRDTRYNLVNID